MINVSCLRNEILYAIPKHCDNGENRYAEWRNKSNVQVDEHFKGFVWSSLCKIDFNYPWGLNTWNWVVQWFYISDRNILAVLEQTEWIKLP